MKRLISLLLVMVMLLSMVPTTVLASSYTANYRGSAVMAVNTNTATSLQSSRVVVNSVSVTPELDGALSNSQGSDIPIVEETAEGILVDAELPELEPVSLEEISIASETEPLWQGVVDLPIAEDADEPLPEITEDIPVEEPAEDEDFVELVPAGNQLLEGPLEAVKEPIEQELIPTITVKSENAVLAATPSILSDDGTPIIDEYLPSVTADSADYSTGSYRYFYELRSDGYKYRHYMRCVYIGRYCTVWSDYSADSTLRLSPTNAAAIGKTFDNKFKQMQNTFGNYWYDADNDDKIALMCYDIDNSYASGSSGSYVGGYFWAADMVSATGRINGINYGTGNYVQSGNGGNGSFPNGLDCLSIDTYPAMGSGTPFSNISNCYSTLFHELQHLLNFSYQVKNGSSGYYDSMETYLNEAFSTASEHLIMGSNSVKSRVNYFNGSSYVQGSSLTYWYADGGYGSNYVLSNYTNSYLFGQYIRARYDMLYPGYGDTIYKQVLTRRNASNANNTLGLIASLLKTTKEELITDFWQAVYMKMDSGIYGFGGESWADALSPRIQSSLTNSNASIHCGGAKFYNPGNAGIDAAVDQENIQLRSLYSGKSTGPGVKSIVFERTSPQSGTLTIIPTTNCTMYYAAVYGNVSSKSSLVRNVSLEAGQAYSITYNQTSGLQGNSSPNFYYYLTNSAGSSAMLNLKFPMWSGRFVDVPSDSWYARAVEYVSAAGIMNGTSSTRFSPDGTATRGMLVTMLYRMDGSPSVAGYSNPFRDVASGSYYYKAVLWASRNNIVNGTSPTTFSPNSLITREETVTMMYRYANYKGYDNTNRISLSGFADDHKVSGWSNTALRWAVADGIIAGINRNGKTYLDPQGTANRAQMAVIFQRFCYKYN